MKYSQFEYVMMAPRLIVARCKLNEGCKLLKHYTADLARKMSEVRHLGKVSSDNGKLARCLAHFRHEFELVEALTRELDALSCRISTMEEAMRGTAYHDAIAADAAALMLY